MANKSLDSFLGNDEKNIVDLDWLDINPEEYCNAPFDETPSYISVPKLEQAWNHEDDRSTFNLVPNTDLRVNVQSSVEDEKIEDTRKLFDFVKKQMMSGKTGKDLQEVIQEKTSPHIVKAAFKNLEKLAKEQGLLGYVYVDPKVFTKCEDGAKFTEKKAKTSKYVLKMAKCDGCVFNKSGRCEVYKKALADDISYDQKLLDFYSKHFSNLKGSDVRIASKEDLQNNFLKKEEKSVKVAEFKPKISEQHEKTLEEKSKDYENQLKELEDTLSGIKNSKISKELSMLLVKGYTPKVIKSYILEKFSSEEISSNKDIIDNILSKQGSLGKVYVDSDFIPFNLASDTEARSFLSNYAKDVKYILVKKNASVASCVTKTFNKIVVSDISEIPKEDWVSEFSKYSNEIKDKITPVFENDFKKGLRLAFLQEDINKSKVSTKVSEDFNLKRNVETDFYNPKDEKKFNFSPSLISLAVKKGFTLSSIIKTGKVLGVDNSEIHSCIKVAFDKHVEEVSKYQIDVPISLPQHIKIKISGKDISNDLEKEVDLSSFSLTYSSVEAPVDNSVENLNLKKAELNIDKLSSNIEDLDISGLDQFDIE
jgi:hypothetical protein